MLAECNEQQAEDWARVQQRNKNTRNETCWRIENLCINAYWCM